LLLLWGLGRSVVLTALCLGIYGKRTTSEWQNKKVNTIVGS